MNRWPGRRGRRGWRECVHQLAEAIDETRLDQTALSQILHLVRPYSPDTVAENDAAFERFAGRLGRRGELSRRGLLLGEIKAVTPTKGGWRIGLRQTKTPVFLDGPLLTRLKRSYPAVFSAARPQDARQVVLLVVDRSSGGHLRLVDAAAMLTTRDAVPADSSFEVIMADRLVGAGRAFVKPLRFDQGDDLLFPDYIVDRRRAPRRGRGLGGEGPGNLRPPAANQARPLRTKRPYAAAAAVGRHRTASRRRAARRAACARAGLTAAGTCRRRGIGRRLW